MNVNTTMDELDKNLPDDFWRKTFDEAAETPPPRVWAAIERKLDESDGPKVIPMWGAGLASSRPLIWGAGLAAAVALLLVGWWVLKTQTASISQVAHNQQATSSPKTAAQPGRVALTQSTSQGHSVADAARQGSADVPAPVIEGQVASNTLPSATSGRFMRSPMASPARTTQADEIRLQTGALPTFNSGSAALQESIKEITTVATVQQRALMPVAASHMATVSFMANQGVVNEVDAKESGVAVAFDKLSGRPMRLRAMGAIQRIVWARPAEVPMDEKVARTAQKSRERWASVSMMPSSFNPLVSVRNAQPAIVNTSLAYSNPSNPSAVSSRASLSVAYQAGAGIQLTDHWSVESGIGYLAGRSTVETPGQQYLASVQMDALANRNTGLNNAYVDALRNSVHSNDMAGITQASYANLISKTSSNYSSQNLQTVTNNYQYVQVPVQVGYQFRPRKKLSMAVLGGLLTNIFVKNTVADALVVTAKDGVYQPVSLAATMGARLRYRPSRQWSASVAGMYQPSLESSTKSDAQVQNHPTSAGMSFGVDYHF